MSKSKLANRLGKNRPCLSNFAGSAFIQMEALEPRLLMSAAMHHGRWLITGDLDPSNADDHITIQISPDDPQQLVATINGNVVDTRPIAGMRSIHIRGGRGNDVIEIDLGDLAIPMRISGGAGNDTITGGAGPSVISGSAGDDTIYGGAGHNRIYGRAGNDTITGGDSADVIFGGWGNDVIHGGAGNDRLYGQRGSDTIYGEVGENSLWGGRGDTLYGDSSKDRMHVRRGDVARPGPLAPTGDIHVTPQWLIDNSVKNYRYLFGTRKSDMVMFDSSPNISGELPLQVSSSTTAGGDILTNVDELYRLNVVQTDGHYLYVCANQTLFILSPMDADGQSQIISRISLPGIGGSLYVYENRVTIISQTNPQDGELILSALPESAPDRAEVRLTVVDIADPSQPRVVEQTVVPGVLRDSRQIDGRIYMVITNSLWLPGPRTHLGQDGHSYYETEGEYRHRMQGMAQDYLSYSSTMADGTTQSGQVLHVLRVTDDESLYNASSVLMLDPTDEAGWLVDAIAMTGTAENLVFTPNSLYFATEGYDMISGSWSIVNQYDLQARGPVLVASCHIEGRVTHIDEQDGFVQVFTEGTQLNGHTYTDRTWITNLLILQRQNDHLEVVSSLLNVGPYWQVDNGQYYAGDYWWSNTKPLDLSDPLNPRVLPNPQTGLGENMRPSGMLTLDSGRLLCVEGEFNSQTGYRWQLSLMDASDPTALVRLDSLNLSSTAYGNFGILDSCAESGVVVARDANVGGLMLYRVAGDSLESLGSIHCPGGLSTTRVGNLLYVAGGSGIIVIDLAAADPVTSVKTLDLGPA